MIPTRSIIIGIVTLFLFSGSLVSAESVKVANATFYVIYLCEQPSSNPDLNHIYTNFEDVPCEYKEINVTKMDENVHFWIESLENITIKKEEWSNKTKIVPCKTTTINLTIKNPDFQIYYDGTWLIFEKKTGSFWIDPENFHQIRECVDDDTYILAKKAMYNLGCTGHINMKKITTITSITSFKLDNKRLYDLNKSDVDIVCSSPDHNYASGGFYHIFYRDVHFNPDHKLQDLFGDICIISDKEKWNFQKSYILMFRHLEWIRKCYNIYEDISQDRWGEKKWRFTENITDIKKEVEGEYKNAVQEYTAESLLLFLENYSQNFSEKKDILNNENNIRMRFTEDTLNKTVLPRATERYYTNLTYPIFYQYYEEFIKLNDKADKDIISLENDFRGKLSDIRSRYSILILTKQTEDNRLMLWIVFLTLLVAIGSLGITFYQVMSTEKSNKKVIEAIEDLPQNIKDLQEPPRGSCVIEGLIRWFFKK